MAGRNRVRMRLCFRAAVCRRKMLADRVQLQQRLALIFLIGVFTEQQNRFRADCRDRFSKEISDIISQNPQGHLGLGQLTMRILPRSHLPDPIRIPF